MKQISWIIGAALAGWVSAGPASVEAAMAVGSYASYQMREGGETRYMDYAVVGEDRAQNALWLQMTQRAAPNGEPEVIMQALVSRAGQSAPLRVLMKPKDGEVMEMPTSMWKQQVRKESGVLATAVRTDRQTVQVPAGTFNCVHAVLEEGETWVNDQAMMGMVKVITKSGGTIELTQYGTNGRIPDLIPHKPAPGAAGGLQSMMQQSQQMAPGAGEDTE